MRAVAIIGMHRSGTSLVAQALAACGISPGPSSDLLSAQSDNPEGFFENRRLVEINDQLLAAASGHWYAPMATVAPPDPALRQAMQNLVQSLVDASAGQFFIKDPRLCLTWEHWAEALDDAQLIYVYRSPLAVAHSLARRNRFPLQYGILLWEVYNRRALALLQERSFMAISYNQLLGGAVSLEDLIVQLQEQGFDCEPARAASVFRAELQHFSGAESESESVLLNDAQRRLHDYCTRVCGAQERLRKDAAEADVTAVDEAQLARVRDFAAALEPLARVVETTNERDEAVALVAERTAERDTALDTLQTLETDHGALVEAHAEEKRLHARAASTLDQLNADHRALAEAHAVERSRHAALADKFIVLQKDAAELREKTDFLFFSLTESYRKLLSFETSMMARLQRIVRRAYRLLTGQRGRNSAYEDLLASAREHFGEYELEPPTRRRNKLDMLFDVLGYMAQNPVSSLRSFSWSRLRRGVSVFLGNSTEDLDVWVNARFPGRTSRRQVFDPTALDPDLDILELQFPHCDKPRVSIIIPVYNDYRVTMHCLSTVLEHSGDVAYEVIVADDCSTDLTATIGERVSGIRVARTQENQRFLRNCNQAAALARGEVLLFLNNDTAVTEGWLEALLEPLNDPDIGATGPKLLFADGSLQEAGGIIWRDASGWNFGRGDDPEKPAYSYRRDVDYVSGACLAIRRELWERLGGFDERFAPAYYEDADLCFSVRKAGSRVVYVPDSVVFHFEGVSNGTDLNSGVKQHQVTNQEVFRQKWQSELDARHFPNAEHVIHARDRSAGRYCVLIIDHYVPHFDRDAGGRSTYLYAKLLLKLGCRVQFMGANFFPHHPYTEHLQSLGIEVLVGESVARNLGTWFDEHASYIDEVIVHRPHVAEQFMDHLERMRPKPLLSFFGHDLHYLRMSREAELKSDDKLHEEAERWRKREHAVFDRVDRVYYFSQAELDALAGSVPAEKLRHVPLYAMPLRAIPDYAPAEPHSLLFVGGYNHPPNVDAALWLVREILPGIQASVPDVRVHLVGSNVPGTISALANESVIVHGYLTDDELDALYRRVAVALVPLQYGAGVKGKVIEGVNQGVPVVTTSIGAEGIPDAPSVMWVEDTAEGLAAVTARILSGAEPLHERFGMAQSWLQRHFSLQAAAESLRADRPALQLLADAERAA